MELEEQLNERIKDMMNAQTPMELGMSLGRTEAILDKIVIREARRIREA